MASHVLPWLLRSIAVCAAVVPALRVALGMGFVKESTWELGAGLDPFPTNTTIVAMHFEVRAAMLRVALRFHNSTPMRCGSETGSYLRLINSFIAQLKAQGPSRTWPSCLRYAV